MLLLLLHRLKVPLDRDVIFLAEAGEESSTQFGIDFMVERHWDKIAAEFSMAEGGHIVKRGSTVTQVVVTAAEKLSRNMKLVAHGVSAHGSVPRVDNPLLRLSVALAKLANWRQPMRLNEVTRAYFSRLAAISPPEDPAMTTGTTDSAQLRAKGVQAYGIGTFGGSGAHGNDERISVEGLGALVEFLYNAVVEVAATR